MSWRWSAACGQQPESVQDLFFSEDHNDILKAQCVCAGCPVAFECLDYALSSRQPEGVWGMHTPKQRRRLTRQARTRNRQDVIVESFTRIESALYEHAIAAQPLRGVVPTPDTVLNHKTQETGTDLTPGSPVRSSVA